jgi:hypothetical protein
MEGPSPNNTVRRVEEVALDEVDDDLPSIEKI